MDKNTKLLIGGIAIMLILVIGTILGLSTRPVYVPDDDYYLVPIETSTITYPGVEYIESATVRIDLYENQTDNGWSMNDSNKDNLCFIWRNNYVSDDVWVSDWDTVTGHAIVWARLPLLETGNTTITVCEKHYLTGQEVG